MTDDTHEPPMEIPASALSADALHGLIREFIITEAMGSDPGEDSMDDSIAKVKKLLKEGKGKILYDPSSSTCQLVMLGRN